MEKKNNSSLLSATVMIIVGIILAVFSGEALITILRVVGIGLLVVGAIGVISYFTSNNNEEKSFCKMLISAVEAIGGLLVLAAPKLFLNIYPIAMGILITLDGFGNLFQAFSLKKTGLDSWKTMLILAIISIVLGIVIICNPFSTISVLTTIIGVILIYDGILKLIPSLKK